MYLVTWKQRPQYNYLSSPILAVFRKNCKNLESYAYVDQTKNSFIWKFRPPGKTVYKMTFNTLEKLQNFEVCLIILFLLAEFQVVLLFSISNHPSLRLFDSWCLATTFSQVRKLLLKVTPVVAGWLVSLIGILEADCSVTRGFRWRLVFVSVSDCSSWLVLATESLVAGWKLSR